MERCGCPLNSTLLNVVVQSLLERGDIMKARELLHKMEELKFRPEASTLSMLVDLHRKDRDFQSCLQLLADFSKHQVQTFSEAMGHEGSDYTVLRFFFLIQISDTSPVSQNEFAMT
ncbi:uncharacterized protein A4U43_C08F18080 [Asparagus officinalis]|nr:uncharacterized protein A4U43_C08F18080 [Asparagus officinalis]